MRRKLIWPGLLFVLIGAIVVVDVTMLVIASTADIYTVVPTEELSEEESP